MSVASTSERRRRRAPCRAAAAAAAAVDPMTDSRRADGAGVERLPLSRRLMSVAAFVCVLTTSALAEYDGMTTTTLTNNSLFTLPHTRPSSCVVSGGVNWLEKSMID